MHVDTAAVSLAAALLSLPIVSVSATGTAVGSDLSADLARCRGIEDSGKRLACFDAMAVRQPAEKTASAAVISDTSAEEPPASKPMTAETVPAVEGSPRRSGGESERRFLGVRLYRQNYMLPVDYNDNPNRNLPAAESIPFLGHALDNVEMKFQISFEVPIWTEILNQPLDLYFAYTQLAFFQVYDRKYSSPFRETNYEPELGFNWQPDLSAFGWRLSDARVMLDHQSNGRSDPISRSWNRLIGQAGVERGPLAVALRLWSPLGAKPSDNPDIYEYLGYGELHLGYDLEKHHFGVMLRSPTHPTVQLDWSYPLSDTIRFYVQYFNGYGESLLDYNHPVNRIGVGFLVNTWP